MVLGIQVFGLVFSAFMLYLSFLYYKKKEFTLIEWSFWTFFSIVFAVISVFPEILDPIVASLNLTRTLDLFIILGFMFLIATVFYIYRVTRHTNKQVEELVRELALENKKK